MAACPHCGEDLGKPGAATRKAMDFLGAALPAEGWHLSAPIRAEAVRQGISERTLRLAARDLGVEHRRQRRRGAATEWRHAPLIEQPDLRSAVVRHHDD
jgi:hypothetical protein